MLIKLSALPVNKMAQKQHPLKHNLTIGAIVLAVILFFMFVFRIDESIAVVETSEKNLFHLSPRGPGVSSYQQEQAARDELDDPTLMSFPNLVHGFSQIRKGKGEPPIPNLPVYNFKDLELSETKPVRTPLVKEFLDPVSQAGNTLKQPELVEISTVKSKGRFSKRIIWLEDGSEKLSPFKMDELLKITKNKIPQGRTKISILKVSTGYIFMVLEKCGISQLDKMVLDYFKKKSVAQFTDASKKEILPEFVLVDWRLLQIIN